MKRIALLLALLCASAVTHAATLGNTGTPDTPMAYDNSRVWAFDAGAMPSAGTLQSVSVYVTSTAGFGNQPFAVGVYSGDASFPSTLITSGTGTAIDGTPGWVTITLSGSLTSGAHIWIGVIHDPSNGSNTLKVYGTAAGTLQNIRQGNFVSSYPTIPSPWSNDDTFTQNAPAGYITYTTGAAIVLNPICGKGGAAARPICY